MHIHIYIYVTIKNIYIFICMCLLAKLLIMKRWVAFIFSYMSPYSCDATYSHLFLEFYCFLHVYVWAHACHKKLPTLGLGNWVRHMCMLRPSCTPQHTCYYQIHLCIWLARSSMFNLLTALTAHAVPYLMNMEAAHPNPDGCTRMHALRWTAKSEC